MWDSGAVHSGNMQARCNGREVPPGRALLVHRHGVLRVRPLGDVPQSRSKQVLREEPVRVLAFLSQERLADDCTPHHHSSRAVSCDGVPFSHGALLRRMFLLHGAFYPFCECESDSQPIGSEEVKDLCGEWTTHDDNICHVPHCLVPHHVCGILEPANKSTDTHPSTCQNSPHVSLVVFTSACSAAVLANPHGKGGFSCCKCPIFRITGEG